MRKNGLKRDNVYDWMIMKEEIMKEIKEKREDSLGKRKKLA